jgi:hypothetical protein
MVNTLNKPMKGSTMVKLEQRYYEETYSTNEMFEGLIISICEDLGVNAQLYKEDFRKGPISFDISWQEDSIKNNYSINFDFTNHSINDFIQAIKEFKLTKNTENSFIKVNK